MPVITDISLWELIRHLRRWLANLARAGSERKRASIDALRAWASVERRIFPWSIPGRTMSSV